MNAMQYEWVMSSVFVALMLVVRFGFSAIRTRVEASKPDEKISLRCFPITTPSNFTDAGLDSVELRKLLAIGEIHFEIRHCPREGERAKLIEEYLKENGPYLILTPYGKAGRSKYKACFEKLVTGNERRLDVLVDIDSLMDVVLVEPSNGGGLLRNVWVTKDARPHSVDFKGFNMSAKNLARVTFEHYTLRSLRNKIFKSGSLDELLSSKLN